MLSRPAESFLEMVAKLAVQVMSNYLATLKEVLCAFAHLWGKCQGIFHKGHGTSSPIIESFNHCDFSPKMQNKGTEKELRACCDSDECEKYNNMKGNELLQNCRTTEE